MLIKLQGDGFIDRHTIECCLIGRLQDSWSPWSAADSCESKELIASVPICTATFLASCSLYLWLLSKVLNWQHMMWHPIFDNFLYGSLDHSAAESGRWLGIKSPPEHSLSVCYSQWVGSLRVTQQCLRNKGILKSWGFKARESNWGRTKLHLRDFDTAPCRSDMFSMENSSVWSIVYCSILCCEPRLLQYQSNPCAHGAAFAWTRPSTQYLVWGKLCVQWNFSLQQVCLFFQNAQLPQKHSIFPGISVCKAGKSYLQAVDPKKDARWSLVGSSLDQISLSWCRGTHGVLRFRSRPCLGRASGGPVIHMTLR